jgi:penicillin-insensitive murein DD-endopeptidase
MALIRGADQRCGEAMRHLLPKAALAGLAALLLAGSASAGDLPAKQAFGAEQMPSAGAPQPIGFYAKGCLAGAMAIPMDGPHWEVMRPSRNRRWGHPELIAFIERLSRNAAKAGWPGLLIGDMAQPRGGPMITGHASHQIGLDVDLWYRPMPNHTLSDQERESWAATSVLKPHSLYVDPSIWTPAHTALLKAAATDPEVERIFVHPGIKKLLCDTVTGDRSWLHNMRPYWGHDDHFHVRLKCPEGSRTCKGQEPIPPGDGCDKSLAWWFAPEPWKPAPKPTKPVKPRIVMVSDLPPACRYVLTAPAPASVAAVTYHPDAPASASAAGSQPAFADVPLPAPKPANP